MNERREPLGADAVPEADAQEQDQEVVPDDDVLSGPPGDPEVPEADALEQSRTIGVEEDDELRAP